MKKVISLVVCFVLIVTAICIDQQGLFIGGARIRNEEDVKDLLRSAVYLLSGEGFQKNALMTDSELTVLSNASDPALAKQSDEDFLNSDIPYTGMTIREKLSSSMSGTIAGKSFMQKQSGDAVLYLTEDAVRIEADVRMYASYAGLTTTLAVVAKYYIDAENVYIMIESYDEKTTRSGSAAEDEEAKKEREEQDKVIKALCGKWLDCSEGMGSLVSLLKTLALNSLAQTLHYYSDYFDEHGDDAFLKTGDLYVLKEDEFVDFVEGNHQSLTGSYGNISLIEYADMEDLVGSFTVDLSDSAKPKIDQSFFGTYEEDGIDQEGEKCTNRYSCENEVSLTFEHIGITKAHKPAEADVWGMKKIEELMEDVLDD